MKRYYIPKNIPRELHATPLLVVSGGWHKWFDDATKARRAVPPVGRRRSPCRGWTLSVTDQFDPRIITGAYLELRPGYISQIMRRVREHVYWTHANIQAVLPNYMLIPAPDYARLKTNHKIGAPKGRLP